MYSALLLFLGAASLFQPTLTACDPPSQNEPDFDLIKFSGMWYAIKEIPNPIEDRLHCVQIDYILYDDTQFRAEERGLLNLIGTEVADIRNGSIVEPENPAHIEWGGADVWVLDTDYDQYAVLYNCDQPLGITVQLGWILSRNRTLSATLTADAADKFLWVDGLGPDDLEEAKQDNCPDGPLGR